MSHKVILHKIESIKSFFESIGFKKHHDIPTDWNLDSSIKYLPPDKFQVNINNEDRLLLSVDIFIVGGIHFVLSGKIGHSVYETIKTDYDLNPIYDDKNFFKKEYRDWKIKNLI
jgi:hypothetical protein